MVGLIPPSDLLALIAQCPVQEATWEQRVRWWGDFLAALRVHGGNEPYLALATVVTRLEQSPIEASSVAQVLITTLTVCETGRTLTDTGIPIRPTFTSELLRRLMAKVVPPVAEPNAVKQRTQR